jgi:hypothetical protein
MPPSCGRLLVAAIFLVALLLPGCLFKGKKGQESRYPTAPIRIALLPFNTPDDPDIEQSALAALVIMAEVVERAPDLEAVPLWEVMPVATETLRTSREITPETAAYLATRMTARWATQGQIVPGENRTLIRLDFIPARTSVFPFRFEKEDELRSLPNHLNEAFKQFINYLIARPIEDPRGGIDPAGMSKIADAINLEYGWYVDADPGKASSVVSDLLSSNRQLARFLFNPSLYPSIDEGTEPPPPSEP